MGFFFPGDLSINGVEEPLCTPSNRPVEGKKPCVAQNKVSQGRLLFPYRAWPAYARRLLGIVTFQESPSRVSTGAVRFLAHKIPRAHLYPFLPIPSLPSFSCLGTTTFFLSGITHPTQVHGDYGHRSQANPTSTPSNHGLHGWVCSIKNEEDIGDESSQKWEKISGVSCVV